MPPNWTVPQTVFCNNWVSCWLCFAIVQGYYLGSLVQWVLHLYPAVEWSWKLCSSLVLGFSPGSLLGLDCRLCFSIGQSHRMSSLHGWGHSLCSVIRQDWSASGWHCRLSSVAWWYRDWALRVLKVPVQAPWFCKARSYTQQLIKVVGLTPWPGGSLNVLWTFQVSSDILLTRARLGGYAQQWCKSKNFLCFQAGHRIHSTAAEHLWPCFPERWDWELSSEVGQNEKCAPLPSW